MYYGFYFTKQLYGILFKKGAFEHKVMGVVTTILNTIEKRFRSHPCQTNVHTSIKKVQKVNIY